MADDDAAGAGLGPAIYTKLLAIEVKVESLASIHRATSAVMAEVQANARRIEDLLGRAERHWAGEERRFRLIDQFIDPELDLDSAIAQLMELLRRDHAAVAQVEQELRRLAAAVELALSAPPDAPTPPP